MALSRVVFPEPDGPTTPTNSPLLTCIYTSSSTAALPTLFPYTTLIGEPGDADHSWLGLMRFNYVTMVEALGGDASALKTVDVSDVVKDNATYPQ